MELNYEKKIKLKMIKIKKIIDNLEQNLLILESDNKIVYLEPPYLNECCKNCKKIAGYQKNNKYYCWFHIYNN